MSTRIRSDIQATITSVHKHCQIFLNVCLKDRRGNFLIFLVFRLGDTDLRLPIQLRHAGETFKFCFKMLPVAEVFLIMPVCCVHMLKHYCKICATFSQTDCTERTVIYKCEFCMQCFGMLTNEFKAVSCFFSSNEMVKDPRIPLLSFTGSNAVSISTNIFLIIS